MAGKDKSFHTITLLGNCIVLHFSVYELLLYLSGICMYCLFNVALLLDL